MWWYKLVVSNKLKMFIYSDLFVSFLIILYKVHKYLTIKALILRYYWISTSGSHLEFVSFLPIIHRVRSRVLACPILTVRSSSSVLITRLFFHEHNDNDNVWSVVAVSVSSKVVSSGTLSLRERSRSRLVLAFLLPVVLVQ